MKRSIASRAHSKKPNQAYGLSSRCNPYKRFFVKSWCNPWLPLNAEHLFGPLSSLLHAHYRCFGSLEMKVLPPTTIYSFQNLMALRPFLPTVLKPMLCEHPARISCRSKHRSLMTHLYCQQAETTTSSTVLCIGSFQVIRHGIHRRRTSTRLGQTQPIFPTARSLCRRADRISRVRQS